MKNKTAFTLIEMLTSIGIIVMVTAIFLANYRTSNRRSDLLMTAQKVVADIHAAQNNTLGLVNYGDSFPAGGWGINFDIGREGGNQQYILFADLNSPEVGETGEEIPADYDYMRYNEGEGSPSLGARTVDLPNGIIIDSIETSNGGTDMANITFLPPDPRTNIFDGNDKAKYLIITLKDENEGTIKKVRANFLGLAEVIN